MVVMTDVDPAPLLGTSAFRLGVVGAVVAERYAAEIADCDVKPKHVGILALLAAAPAASQLDLARTMGVAPSLIVRLADDLERIGAIDRVRDPADRRRQALRLTAHGTDLLAECTRRSQSMEHDLLTGLSAPDRSAFRAALAQVATNLHLPS